jgi:hypothetical protein
MVIKMLKRYISHSPPHQPFLRKPCSFKTVLVKNVPHKICEQRECDEFRTRSLKVLHAFGFQ